MTKTSFLCPYSGSESGLSSARDSSRSASSVSPIFLAIWMAVRLELCGLLGSNPLSMRYHAMSSRLSVTVQNNNQKLLGPVELRG